MIDFINVKKYYEPLNNPHQVEAIEYIGELLLTTQVKDILNLTDARSWIKLDDKFIEWLQRQIGPLTIHKFETLWRKPKVVPTVEQQVKYFSQRDNKILPYTSCNSSAHSMFVDFVLRVKLGKEGLKNDDEYVSRVYSNKYGTYGKNNSMSFDVQANVCRSFGVKAKYTNKGKSSLIKTLQKDMIAPTNFKHKGSLSSPYGGHVVTAVDYTKEKGFLLFDPYGHRMPYYNDPSKGTYWMSEKEFDARWQHIYTEYLGPV